MTVTLAGALVIGAYAAGCGGGATGEPGEGEYHSYGGGPATTSSGSGSSSGSSSSGGSSTGSSGGSSTGSSSTGSSSGSTSGSDSGSTATPDAGPPPVSLQEALTAFAGCMQYSDFTSTTTNGVAASDIAKAQTTQYGDCNACHNAGDGGFWASYGQVQGQDMTQVMFQQTQMFPYITKWVTGTGTPCHPKFQLNPAVVQAIQDFVNVTLTRWQNNQCTGSGLPSDAGLGEGG
ncbi:MAG: hypothetical protein ABSE49_23090 [Polyangiaceae bacterium]